MKKIVLYFLLLTTFLASCEIAQNVVKVIEDEIPLTEDEVIRGLKEALRVSTDTAVSVVSVLNGYYGDKLIKIALPPEADIIVKNKNNALLKAAGVDKLIDDAVIRLNRAAEDAAKTATPIFTSAITSMTIQDAFNILNGSDTAATWYFRKKTYTKLENNFKSKVRTSLNKPLFGNVSASKTWNSLTDAYNSVAVFTGWKKVNTNLDEYVTRKALDGLFVKIKAEEIKIRKDPKARVTDILEKVFGK